MAKVECRSGDCDAAATHEVVVAPGPEVSAAAKRVEGRVWRGTFCRKHLVRVIPARLQMLMSNESMMIVKLKESGTNGSR